MPLARSSSSVLWSAYAFVARVKRPLVRVRLRRQGQARGLALEESSESALYHDPVGTPQLLPASPICRFMKELIGPVLALEKLACILLEYSAKRAEKWLVVAFNKVVIQSGA